MNGEKWWEVLLRSLLEKIFLYLLFLFVLVALILGFIGNLFS
jgi:hypothetical protein